MTIVFCFGNEKINYFKNLEKYGYHLFYRVLQQLFLAWGPRGARALRWEKKNRIFVFTKL